MKKLINRVEMVVDDMLEGFAAAYPQYVRRVPDTHVVARAGGPERGKVGLVSGGGSGHEPSHGGYVGYGMLDAAVAGAVFTSPTPDQVFAGVKAADGGAGVLLVVKNYTGDIMNFEMAGELAAAEGIEVASVVVNDDVAVENSTWTTGRRGIAGTVLVHKIAGAKAQAGAHLSEVKRVAEKVIANVRTMGMALTPCVVPANGKPTFQLGETEVEIGMGIHGEPGTHREQLRPAAEIATHLTRKVTEDLNLKPGEEVAVLINGLGGTPLMELFIINKTVAELLHEAKVKVHRTIVGEYMTSLEMAGCSVTVLRLDDELKALLEAPAETPAFRQGR
jgi:dihydroxyacetone kinase-like protein